MTPRIREGTVDGEPIQRYDYAWREHEFQERTDGDWVRYEDHVTALAAARARAVREADARYEPWVREAAVTLHWALDLIRMYDQELMRRGDPPELNQSPTHLAGLARADSVLATLAALAGPATGENNTTNT